jgi:predicted amidohydrolase
MLIKVAAVQSKLGETLSLEERLFIFKQKPDFVCLPEYFFINESTPDFSRAALTSKDNLKYLQALSEALATVLIGGSIVESDSDSLFNSTYLFQEGRQIGKYRKLSPVVGEIEKGILPGDRLYTTTIDGIKIALLICADALNIDLFEALKPEKVDIIFIPTTSPLRPGEKQIEKFKRDNDIFLRAAQTAGSFIIKTCGVGNLFHKPLQGRSLIVSPWGIIKRVDPISEDSPCILTAVLDIDELHDFRHKQQLADLIREESQMVESNR